MKRCALCPAARPLAGPPIGGPSVVCAILLREGGGQDTVTEGGEYPHITVRHDPSTYLGFCTGDELPILDDEDLERRTDRGDRPPRSYTVCPIWQEEKKRIAEAKINDKADWSGESYRRPEDAEDLRARIEA